MRLEEIDGQLAVWQEKAASLWRRVRGDLVHTYLLSAAGRLWVADVRGRKFLRHFSVPLTDRNNRAALLEALTESKKQGLHGKSLLLLASFPGLRVGVKKFPDMTADELKETLYWEQDRIFYNGDALALAGHVLQHTAEGYTVFLHGVPKDILTLWQDAAEEAGLGIQAAIPVTDICVGEVPSFTLYERQRSAILVWRGGHVETRVVKLTEEGRGALFMRHVLGQKEMPDVPLYLVPLADVDKETGDKWRDWVEEELAAFQEGTVEDVGGDIELDAPEEEAALYPEEMEEPVLGRPGHTKVILCELAKDMDGSGWSDVWPLFLKADTAGARILAHEEAPFEEEERRPLRLAQGAAALAGLFFLISAGGYVVDTVHFHQIEQRAETLTPQRDAYEAYKQKEKQSQEKLELLKKLDKENPLWEQKLVTLADTMPDGVVLKGLRAERGAATVHIEGNAQTGEALVLFRKRLQWGWGGHARIEKQERNALTHLIDFSVEWKRGEERD